MANELRVRQNFLGGLVEDNPLTSGATTLTSTALAAMSVIGTTQHMPITLDPDGIGGDPEIVWVTAHTASATTATILRGQEGTTAREHRRDINWTHGPAARDFSGESYAWFYNTSSTTRAEDSYFGLVFSSVNGSPVYTPDQTTEWDTVVGDGNTTGPTPYLTKGFWAMSHSYNGSSGSQTGFVITASLPAITSDPFRTGVGGVLGNREQSFFLDVRQDSWITVYVDYDATVAGRVIQGNLYGKRLGY